MIKLMLIGIVIYLLVGVFLGILLRKEIKEIYIKYDYLEIKFIVFILFFMFYPIFFINEFIKKL